jgi:hypothetical protein
VRLFRLSILRIFAKSWRFQKVKCMDLLNKTIHPVEFDTVGDSSAILDNLRTSWVLGV